MKNNPRPEFFNNAIAMPECTSEEYARRVGVTLRIVEGWIARGYLPTVKRGKWRLINIAAITQENIASCQAKG